MLRGSLASIVAVIALTTLTTDAVPENTLFVDRRHTIPVTTIVLTYVGYPDYLTRRQPFSDSRRFTNFDSSVVRRDIAKRLSTLGYEFFDNAEVFEFTDYWDLPTAVSDWEKEVNKSQKEKGSSRWDPDTVMLTLGLDRERHGFSN